MSERSIRQITDSRVLAAMAHPLRRRLMDVLRVDGPATASMLAGRTGQAVGNISHHLRILARGELIEQAPELARDRRERWWRLSADSVRWSTSDFEDDPAVEAVEQAVMSLNLERQVELVRAYNATGPAGRRDWPTGPFSTNHWLQLNDAELAELAGEVIALFSRWADREIADDGQQRDTVFAFAHGVPAQP